MPSIQEECATRSIDRLFHFTPVEHLDSVLRRGLLVPSGCRTQNVGMTPNDAARYDGQDAICLSIEWPNWQLFWRFQQQDTSRPWAIIQIQHRVLWEKRVCFNTTNAADNAMSAQSFEDRRGLHKFLELFGDCSGKTRDELNLHPHWTTNPQAEVLCLDTIEPAYFSAVLLNNTDVYNAYKPAHHQANILYQSHYFAPRADWRHWK
ncbi:DarT ssDNA thymidine ADP-ribosyltransferase family protein [Variovorax boronicumulans]|uniref:DarT ssDNA thymidine ADP-ribosyltransferase family protein n=1 Tax=Variovorax boronicumulans TaxID=436515 RepID=UPI0036F1B94E